MAEGPAKLLLITHRGSHSLLDSSTDVRAAIMGSLADRLRGLEPDAAG